MKPAVQECLIIFYLVAECRTNFYVYSIDNESLA